MRITFRRLALPVTAVVVLGLAHAMPSGAVPTPRGGTIASLNASQSSNWSGYNQGALESGKTFTQVAGDWVVPSARQHTRGQAEYSSVWVGIGGGCIDADCAVGDVTLIQAGTEQDVGTGGKATYSAWWEIIPAPAITIDMAVRPGDRMHVDVSEAAPNVWTITMKNLNTGASFEQTVPYTSTHATAEWIVETPLLIGTDGAGFTALPNLGKVPFANATANGANAGLKASEAIQLVDANTNKVIATPSAPDATGNAFYDCTWSTSCSAGSVKLHLHR